MGHVRQRSKIGDIELGIADGFGVHGLGGRTEGRRKRFGIIAVDEAGLDAELRKRHRQLRVGAAVERFRGNDMVARLGERQQRNRLRRHAGRCGECCTSAFECGHSFLQRGHRGIGNARIDVAEGLQVEQRGGVIGAVEHEGRGLVDRQRASAGGRVGNLAGVQAQRVEIVAVSLTSRRVARKSRRY